jgi:hypothetical protein
LGQDSLGNPFYQHDKASSAYMEPPKKEKMGDIVKPLGSGGNRLAHLRCSDGKGQSMECDILRAKENRRVDLIRLEDATAGESKLGKAVRRSANELAVGRVRDTGALLRPKVSVYLQTDILAVGELLTGAIVDAVDYARAA